MRRGSHSQTVLVFLRRQTSDSATIVITSKILSYLYVAPYLEPTCLSIITIAVSDVNRIQVLHSVVYRQSYSNVRQQFVLLILFVYETTQKSLMFVLKSSLSSYERLKSSYIGDASMISILRYSIEFQIRLVCMKSRRDIPDQDVRITISFHRSIFQESFVLTILNILPNAHNLLSSRPNYRFRRNPYRLVVDSGIIYIIISTY